ncbi:hypothetical protein AJ80_02686 [Polytolypa hystricis UAMH7299]|uniref:RRM domain-containing protein n=1 Tax=Polytolypa hystricis (strain UAMH7299) TaxID=1447883 RepID=A0A2B7YQ14_POLH7|nr:hypothetical protein AJ80_02686 [Polytolypa hystricis UAMH7299]
MPVPSRQRDGRRGSTRSVEEEYVVFLQGIPPQCRWQELKDLVRQTALHIRQAVVYDDCHGHPTGLGQIIVKNEEEAWRTYNRLATNGWNGHSLTVTLSLASAPTKPIAGPTKSPTLGRVPYPAAPRCAPLVSPTCTLSPDIPSPPPYPQSPEYAHFVAPISPTAHPQIVSLPPDSIGYQAPLIIPTDGPMPIHTAPVFAPCFEPPQASFHRYPTSANVPHLHDVTLYNRQRPTGLSSQNHTGHSACAILIYNLSPDTTRHSLSDYLRPAGSIERCEMPEESNGSRRSRGYATVVFRTRDEATRAVKLFDNSTFRSANIKVRLARESSNARSPEGRNGINEDMSADRKSSTTTGPESRKSSTDSNASKRSGPLVVNGSRVGLKAGRSAAEKIDYEGRAHTDDLSKKTREIQL